MADNASLPPSGVNAATDEVSYSGDTAHVQLMRLVGTTGSEGSKTVVSIPADSTYGLAADVKRVTPGTGATELGKAEDAAHSSGDVGVFSLAVRDDACDTYNAGAAGDYAAIKVDSVGRMWVRPAPKVVRLSVTPTGSTSAYTSGDCYGGATELANAVRVAGGSGTILAAFCLDKDNDRTSIDLVLFDRTFTSAGDNNAFAPSDADMENCLGVLPINVYNTVWPGTPLNAIASMYNVGVPIVCNGTSLFFQAVLRAAPTKTTTTDLVFMFIILQD